MAIIMKTALALALTFLTAQIQKNNPNGIWESESGTQYELQLSGPDLKVRLVPGSSQRFIQYEVDLKNDNEVNTYTGKGFFVAKVKDGKECRFETEWRMTVVSNTQIFSVSPTIVPDPETCGVKNKSDATSVLKKKN